MSGLVVFHHVTYARSRESIAEFGLLPGPVKGRPFGLYVYSDEMLHGSFSAHSVPSMWHRNKGQDSYRVAYFGELLPDNFVTNGWILLDSATLSELEDE